MVFFKSLSLLPHYFPRISGLIISIINKRLVFDPQQYMTQGSNLSLFNVPWSPGYLNVKVVYTRVKVSRIIPEFRVLRLTSTESQRQPQNADLGRL